jgi:hypothetical protein
MTTGTIDRETVEDWSRSRPRIILVNRDVNPSPTANDLSPELVDQLGGVRSDFLVASREELDRIGIVLAHDQIARFQKGDPILIVAGRVEHREALRRGRRQKEELERSVQEALAVQTYLRVERLSAWLQIRDGRRLAVTVPELRDRVLESLATNAWLDDPNTGGSITEERRVAFFRTQFDAGSRVIASWYSWATRPDDVSSAARELVETDARRMSRALVEEEIQREIDMVRFMLRCLRQSTALVLTAHEMSAEIRKHGRMTRGQQATLAGAATDRPTLYEAVRAARDGDFNPSDLFPGLLNYHNTLELSRLVGRRSRGHDVRLEADLVKEMRRIIAIRQELDQAMRHLEGKGYEGEKRLPSDEQAAALILTQAAFELHPKLTWAETLDSAIAAGSAVVLTGRSGRAPTSR